MLDLSRYHNAISGIQRPDISKEGWLKTTTRFLVGKTPGLKQQISFDIANQIVNKLVPVYQNESDQTTIVLFSNNVIYTPKTDSFILFVTPNLVTYLKGWLVLEAIDLETGENGFLFKFTNNQYFKIVEARQEHADFDQKYFIGESLEDMINYAKKRENKQYGIGHRFIVQGV